MASPPEPFEPLESEAVERIIRRAVVIDAATSPKVGLSADALVAAAGEVGVSADSVRHAIALERVTQVAPRSPGRVDRLVGPADVVVDRQLAVAADELLRRLEVRLETNHQLRRLERHHNGSTWERRSDMAATVKLAVRKLFGDGRLGGARRVTLAVEQLPPSADVGAQPVRSVVRVSVNRGAARTGALIAGTAASAAGVGAAAVGGVLVAPVAATLAVPGVALGSAIAWRARARARHTEHDIRILVDQVAHDDPYTMTGRVIDRLKPKSI